MNFKKAMIALSAVGLALSSVAASPVLAQPVDELDDAGLWLFGGFVIAESILVVVLASEDDIDQVENPPVSPG